MTSAAVLTPSKIHQPRQYRFKLPIRTEKELKQFLRVAWGVEIPDKKVCKEHTTPWRAFADAYFAKHPVAVWKGSRGFAGKTHTLATLSNTEAVTLKANVNLLGGSGAQSTRVLESMANLWMYKNAPRGLLASPPASHHTILKTGAKVNALLASQRSVRGPHPQRLRMDEIDEMDLKILDAALGQPMSAPGVSAQVVLSSTHQYAFGTMTEILKRAAERSWPVYEWCYRETVQPHGWLSPQDVAIKRRTLTKSMWDTEIELQEPAPDSRAFDVASIARMFKEELGEYEGRNGEFVIAEEPEKGATYTTGADWAKEKDWTIIITIRTDVTPLRVVAFQRMGREPWPLLIKAFGKQLDLYPGSAGHDSTGLGNVVGDMLTHDVEPFILVGRTRSDLLSEYIAAVERDEIEAPVIRFMRDEHRLASRDDVFGSGHLPDSICAAAIAYRAAGYGFSPSVW